MTWPADGGVGHITVSAVTDCEWSLDWNAPWITPLQTSGSGNAIVAYAIDRNDSGVTKFGTLTVGGAAFAVTQTNVFTGNPPQGSGGGSSPNAPPTACEFAVSPFIVVMGSGGGTYDVTVKGLAGCPNTILSAPPWTTVSQTSGTGTWTTTVTVEANSTADRRHGTVTLYDLSFAIEQSPSGTDAATIQSFGGDIGSADPRYASIRWELAPDANLVVYRICDGPCHDLPPVPPPNVPDTGPSEGKLSSTEIEWRQGTSTYDPRVAMADYARQLLAIKPTAMSDCQKLALMAYKVGQVAQTSSSTVQVELLLGTLTEYRWFYPGPQAIQPHSDPNYQVGIQTPQLNGFGDTGFKPEYQDTGNQVRHFVASFAAGFIFLAPYADAVTFVREKIFPNGNQPDAALSYLGALLGHNFSVGQIANATQLAQAIWSQVCDQTTPLQLPQ